MVYFVTEGRYIKIGYTFQEIGKRMKQLQTGNGRKVYLLGWVDGGKEKEQELHILFSSERVRYDGEWFSPSERLLEYINHNNLKPNTYVDFIDDKIMPLLTIHLNT